MHIDIPPQVCTAAMWALWVIGTVGFGLMAFGELRIEHGGVPLLALTAAKALYVKRLLVRQRQVAAFIEGFCNAPAPAPSGPSSPSQGYARLRPVD